MDRGDMIGDAARVLDGVDEGGLVRSWGNRYFKRPRVVDEIARPAAWAVDGWRAAQQAAAGPVRAVLTGPYTLMDGCFDEHYRDREACCRAFAEVVAVEAQALLAAGATELQLDEPAAGVRSAEMGLLHEAVARVTEPLAGLARTWLWAGYGGQGAVLPELLALPVDVVLLEAVNSGLEPDARLQALPAHRMLGLGLVDALDPHVETPDVVRGRIERLLEFVPAERLVAVPDGGLRTLTAEQARQKLAALVEAARTV
jgi:5-methyltetrahydropteroyltriglutamate--homocysteine methyltransferase